MKRINVIMMAAALCVIAVSCKKESVLQDNANSMLQSNAANSTAQSVMIDFGDAPSEYVIDGGNEVWKFDETAAAIANHGYNDCGTNACRNAAKNAAKAVKCDYWNQEGHPFWTQTQSANGNGTIDVTYNLTIAGQSVLVSKAWPGAGKKSFTLGTVDASRISNLRYSIDGGDAVALEHTLAFGVDANPTMYTANAGSWGSAQSALVNGATIGSILAGDASNKNELESAIGLSSISAQLGAGDHNVTVSGTIKGNDGAASASFSATYQIHISAEGCGN